MKLRQLQPDTRLGRIIQFDERSLNYPIRSLLAEKSPRSHTWRCDKVLDQGNEGSCVGHGIAHELIAYPAEVKGIDHRYATEQIYWEAQKVDEWDGGAYPGANPVYEGTSVLAGVRVAKKLGWYEGYYWAFSLQDLLLGLSYHGPAVIGSYWYESMFTPDSKGFIKPTGRIAGGHCYLINKIDLDEGCVRVHNSWGTSWGINGAAKVRFKDMEKLLANDGEACFFVHRHVNPKG